ncbi:MAG: hypothetical protein ABJN65_05120 [Parasphingorhabdus sp.]
MTAATISTLMALALTGQSAQPVNVRMGDGQVNGENIKPYNFTWQQCSFKDGSWNAGNPLSEKATIIDDNLLRIEQSGLISGDIRNRTTYYLDRRSLSPRYSERIFSTPNGKTVADQRWHFDKDGYRSVMIKGAETKNKSGSLTSQMFDAMILGVPLSTLDFGKNGFVLKAFMAQFDGTYTLIAHKTGSEITVQDNEEISINWIDVKWLHDQSGDIYPPGPQNSGGRYWITNVQHQTLPRVIRYQTDSYAIEYLQGTCPVPSKEVK